MARVKVHLIDGESFILDYEDYGPMLNVPREAWHQYGIDITEDDIEVLEPVG
jgi:hypothetical protein